MAGYGFTRPRYGAPQAPKASPYVNTGNALAAAAAKKKPTLGDPFGLLTDTTDSARAARINGSLVSRPTTQAPQAPVSTPPPPVAQTTTATAPAPGAPQAPQPVYDVNTDIALQSVNAYTGMSDEQAKAAADKSRRDALLAYGDPNLVRTVLGDDTLAQAAGSNPNSTLARLAHQRDTGLHDLLNSLTTGGHNLGYSGYRVNQEGELGHQYQGALADAASNENALLDQIGSGLVQALQSNSRERAQALGDAYMRQMQWLMAHPPTGAAEPPPPDGGNNPLDLPGGGDLYYDPASGQWRRGIAQTGGRVGY